MEKQTTDYKKTMRTEKQQGVLRNILVYFLLLLWAVIVLFPFYWMLLTSVKSYGSYNAEHIPSFFTLHPTLQNYQDAFTGSPARPLSRQYPVFHDHNDRSHAHCHHTRGICLRASEIHREESDLYALSLPDDDPE